MKENGKLFHKEVILRFPKIVMLNCWITRIGNSDLMELPNNNEVILIFPFLEYINIPKSIRQRFIPTKTVRKLGKCP
jgi:hypothetical protein